MINTNNLSWAHKKHINEEHSSSTDKENDNNDSEISLSIIKKYIYIFQKREKFLTLLQTSVSKVRSDGIVYMLKEKKTLNKKLTARGLKYFIHLLSSPNIF